MADVTEDDPVAQRLTELLGYVEQVIKLDERPAFRLSEYRLATGQTFAFHQHGLAEYFRPIPITSQRFLKLLLRPYGL